jgi:hypothetical protein
MTRALLTVFPLRLNQITSNMIFVVIVFAVDVVECTARNMKSISVEERHRDGVEGRLHFSSPHVRFQIDVPISWVLSAMWL